MSKELKSIDVSHVPEVLRLAEEVWKTKEARVLRRASEEIAILIPVTAPSKRRPARPKAKADYDAFRSSAGSWSDVDTDRFLAEVSASRRSSRPPVELCGT